MRQKGLTDKLSLQLRPQTVQANSACAGINVKGLRREELAQQRITSVTNMAPRAKLSAAEKAANKAAGIEKRKATLAAKKQRNDPAFQANLARANANFGDDEEERARSGNAPEAQQQVDEPVEEDEPTAEPTAPESSNKAGKRPAAPVGGSSAGPCKGVEA